MTNTIHATKLVILYQKLVKEWANNVYQTNRSENILDLQIPPDGFQASPVLQILDLSGNAASLPEHPAFSNLPHLQELYLRLVTW